MMNSIIINQELKNQAYIASNVKMETNVYIGAFSYLGDGVEIEDNVKIYPNSYIGDHTKLKKTHAFTQE